MGNDGKQCGKITSKKLELQGIELEIQGWKAEVLTTTPRRRYAKSKCIKFISPRDMFG